MQAHRLQCKARAQSREVAVPRAWRAGADLAILSARPSRDGVSYLPIGILNFARRRLLTALSCAPAISLLAAETDPAAARIRSFYDLLLETMKQADALGVKGRFEKLA